MTEEPLDVEAQLEENVRKGYMEHVGVNEDGEIIYKLTPAGEARSAALIEMVSGQIDEQKTGPDYDQIRITDDGEVHVKTSREGVVEEVVHKVAEQPETFFTIDLNVHDTYSGEEGFPEKPEPLVWYIFGPFPTEEEAIEWGNRNLQLFGTTAMPVTDPRDYDN